MIEFVGPLVVEAGVAVGRAVTDNVREARERGVQLARARALASADLLVVAASHDRVVTEAERAELASALPPIFERAGVEIGVDELLARWSERLASITTDDALRAAIADAASPLRPADRARTFEAVCALVRADVPPAGTDGPFRAGAGTSKVSTLRVFGDALGIDPDAVAAAARDLARAP